jgi:hypothetical protein
MGWDDACQFCSIALDVPAAIACVRAGDLDAALRHLAAAEESATLWEGTAWEAATAEAKGVVAASRNDLATARTWMQAAAELFERVGQPLDAERCRQAASSYAGGANSSSAMLSKSRNARPEP